MTDAWRDLRLPEALCVAVELKYNQQFGSLNQLLEVVLRELLRNEASGLSAEEHRIVEERLRALGYI